MMLKVLLKRHINAPFMAKFEYFLTRTLLYVGYSLVKKSCDFLTSPTDGCGLLIDVIFFNFYNLRKFFEKNVSFCIYYKKSKIQLLINICRSIKNYKKKLFYKIFKSYERICINKESEITKKNRIRD